MIGFLAEYDALSGLSQEGGSLEKKELTAGGCGHGCGHNLLGAGAMAAALGVKAYLEATGKAWYRSALRLPWRRGRSGQGIYGQRRCLESPGCSVDWHPRM